MTMATTRTPVLLTNTTSGNLVYYTIQEVGQESSVVAQHWSTPISMLFVDGGHGSEPAHADYENWTPKVARGGFLAIHDVFENPADGGRPPYEIYSRALEEGGFEPHLSVGSLQVLRRR